MQEYTSKGTSPNIISYVFKHVEFPPNSVILDYGGGRYDSNIEYVSNTYNSTLLVYDPYNRTQLHNENVLQYFIDKPAKYITCSNVLNVIKEDEVIINILQHIKSLLSDDGVLYITVYPRNRSGIGELTSLGWQRNLPIGSYMKFVEEVFNDGYIIEINKKIIKVVQSEPPFKLLKYFFCPS